MARYDDNYGTPRSGHEERDDWREDRYTSGGSRASRSNIYDEPPLEQRNRSRGRSRSSMEDDEPPEVRFGRNVGDAGEYGSGGTLRDFRDRTSQGRHAGYGDYGEQDYYGTTRGGGAYGGRGDFGGGRDYSTVEPGSRRDFGGRRRDFGDYGYGRSAYGQGFEANPERRRGDYDEGRVSYGYGRRDYRSGPGGFGYAESPYGSGSTSGLGRDWTSGRYGQSYRGRGPKGYTRSDERLQEIICEKLTDDPDIDASEITVSVKDQVVTLEGTVDDRWTKYQVEELIERCGGVKDVRNQLRTQTSMAQQTAYQSSTGSEGSAMGRGKSSSPGSTKL